MNYNSEQHKSSYILFHKKRFQVLLKIIESLILSPEAKILDIGRSPFTNMLYAKYKNVSPLGLDQNLTLLDKADWLSNDLVKHIVYDLNKAADANLWIQSERFALIIFAEVIEHLSIHPEFALKFLSSLLLSNGYLIIQTPNALSFKKRIKMILGRHPYAEYPIDGEIGSHHFREFTKEELCRYSKNAGFDILEHKFINYFPSNNYFVTIINWICGVIPCFRSGQTMILKNAIQPYETRN
jgi:2-polyprenyl-3-methyl-5-hydroxy-6-metoxy-1,4-benzoquinol methylase